MKLNKWKMGLALLAWVVATPAFAQKVRQLSGPGQVIGTYEPNQADNVDGDAFDCYMLQTQKGERWQIKMKPVSGNVMVALGLGVGSSCASTHPLDANTGAIINHAKLNFISGGGTYFIIALNLVPHGTGTYRLELTKGERLALSGFSPPGKPTAAWIMPGWQPVNASGQASSSAAGYRPGTVLRDCETTCPEMVVVPSGNFLMGSGSDEVGRDGDEGPRHEVHFAHPFAVGRYEVTFDEYDACTAAGVCSKAKDNGWGRGRRPAINISWFDAQTYVDWLSKKTGRHYSLLSEAEWEYMARAGTTTPWNTGSAILSDDANILDVFKQTVPVGGFSPNALGIHDTHGNALEWVLDCYEIGYFGVPNDGAAANKSDCGTRVLRGGGFATEPKHARTANRLYASPEEHGGPDNPDFIATGFRVARSL